MAVLALDVDGVLLDPDRGGRGHWSTELPDRFGISPDDLQSAFFTPFWADVVVGRRPIEDSLRIALGEYDQVLADKEPRDDP